MNVKTLNAVIAVVIMSACNTGDARYVRRVYNATPFDAYVNIKVNALDMRSFKVAPGQSVRWPQPNTGPNNLLDRITFAIEQKYVPTGYGTGILDPAKRLDRSKEPDKNDGNFEGYDADNSHVSWPAAGTVNKEFKYIIYGPVYQTTANGRHATYGILRANEDDNIYD